MIIILGVSFPLFSFFIQKLVLILREVEVVDNNDAFIWYFK